MFKKTLLLLFVGIFFEALCFALIDLVLLILSPKGSSNFTDIWAIWLIGMWYRIIYVQIFVSCVFRWWLVGRGLNSIKIAVLDLFIAVAWVGILSFFVYDAEVVLREKMYWLAIFLPIFAASFSSVVWIRRRNKQAALKV